MTKTFYRHLVVGVIYTLLIGFWTWGVSGGDMAYWIYIAMILFIHLILIAIKGKPEGVTARVIILMLDSRSS
jgi:hypothetical protein